MAAKSKKSLLSVFMKAGDKPVEVVERARAKRELLEQLVREADQWKGSGETGRFPQQ
jgi:hypothetical protein